jgi:hypothetical protein
MKVQIYLDAMSTARLDQIWLSHLGCHRSKSVGCEPAATSMAWLSAVALHGDIGMAASAASEQSSRQCVPATDYLLNIKGFSPTNQPLR